MRTSRPRRHKVGGVSLCAKGKQMPAPASHAMLIASFDIEEREEALLHPPLSIQPPLHASPAMSTSPVPVILWCHPRSVSSAFERAFMQRKDTRSYHEPLSMPFYFGKDRPCRRYDDERCQADQAIWASTVEGTLQSLLEEQHYNANLAEGKEACRYIFIKDMAQYIFSAEALKALHPHSTVYKPNEACAKLPSAVENPTVLPIDLLRRFKHTFLIRTPQKSVPSYWKCVQEKAAGFEYFDGAEAGFAELKILYDWMANPESSFHKAGESDGSHTWPGQVQSQPMPPPLIDASVLLADPNHVLSEYCAALGVPFDSSMLSWESGPVQEFAAWGTYHSGAENSTGFKKETPVEKEAEEAARRILASDGSGLSDTASSEADTETESEVRTKAKAKKQMPEEVLETISHNMDAYNYLFAQRSIKAKAR